jgi:hypothetical protein
MSGERSDPPPSIIGFFGKRESSNSLRLMSEEGAFPRGGSSRRFEDKVSWNFCRGSLSEEEAIQPGLGLQDLDILVRGTDPDSDPDPTIIKQKQ